MWTIVISLNCSEKIMFCFVSKQEEVGEFYRGYGHRPTALGVVGKIFDLVQVIKSCQLDD